MEVISTCKVKIRKIKVWGDSRVISTFPLAPNGYNDYFDISTKDAKVYLNTKISKFDVENNQVQLNHQNEWFKYDLIFNNISEYLLDHVLVIKMTGKF